LSESDNRKVLRLRMQLSISFLLRF